MKATSVKPLNSESPFELNELFFSITDRKGIIKACNDVFVRVSEFVPEDLLEKPHNIIRHPDMPRCVFKLLWDYILEGKIMGAYVKNMSKTGLYYWVYALVTPVDDGFVSVRLKPSSKFFPVVQGLYAELLECEQSHGSDWKKGMEEATNLLVSKLNALGFNSYDQFLQESLCEELASRDAAIKAQNMNTNRVNTDIPALFSQITNLSKKREMLLTKADYLSNFSKELELVAINSTVRANFLGRIGAPLSIIGKEISLMSQTIGKELAVFGSSSAKLVEEINKASLSLAISALEQEMSDDFTTKSELSPTSTSEQIRNQGRTSNELIDVLGTNATIYSEQAMDVLKELLASMNKFENTIESLCKVFQVLQFSYVAGCAEIARISEESDFKPLFDNLRSISDMGKNELSELDSALNMIKGSINNSVNLYNTVN